MEAFRRKTYTYADYEKLPEHPAYQLIDGDLVMTPAPTPYHQEILGRMYTTLREFVQHHKLGIVLPSPIDVYLTETETYQPDIVFVSKERMEIIGEKKIEGPPDLLVEILSPGTAYYDLIHKNRIYDTSGVKEYWIVDPQEATIEVLENTSEGFLVAGRVRTRGRVNSRLLKGFGIDIEPLLRPIGE
jgi:Uma2 family endonuclease